MAKKTNCIVHGKKKYRLRMTLPNGKIKSFYGDSKKDAEEKRDMYLANVSPKDDFKSLYLAWMTDVKKPSVANSTYNKYEDKWKVHISTAAFINYKLNAIRSVHLQSFINDRPTANLARVCYIYINEFFKYALRERWINHNPMLTVELPKDTTPNTKKKYLSQADVDKVIAGYKANQVDFVYVFALLTGLRLGELLALNVADIDIEAKTITVSKSMSFERNDNGVNVSVIKTTKNKHSDRLAPIPDSIIKPLKAHLASVKIKHLSLGLPYSDASLAFSNLVCKPMRKDKLTKKWKSQQQKLDIEPVTFHGLRHTFCTLLASNGVDLKTASTLMGHSNIQTTATIYTHVEDTRKREAIKKIDIL